MCTRSMIHRLMRLRKGKGKGDAAKGTEALKRITKDTRGSRDRSFSTYV